MMSTAPLERLGRVQEQLFDCICQFHPPSIIPSLGAVYHTWNVLVFESPSITLPQHLASDPLVGHAAIE
jgi:hypothetical protein